MPQSHHLSVHRCRRCREGNEGHAANEGMDDQTGLKLHRARGQASARRQRKVPRSTCMAQPLCERGGAPRRMWQPEQVAGAVRPVGVPERGWTTSPPHGWKPRHRVAGALIASSAMPRRRSRRQPVADEKVMAERPPPDEDSKWNALWRQRLGAQPAQHSPTAPAQEAVPGKLAPQLQRKAALVATRRCSKLLSHLICLPDHCHHIRLRVEAPRRCWK